MRQAVEVKKEMFQFKPTVTVMSHVKKSGLTGYVSFSVHENVQATWLRGFSLDASALFLRPSLSQNLTGKSAIAEKRSRYRRASLPLLKSFLAEAHLALSEFCVFSDVSATAMVADASRAKADNQQIRHSLTLRPLGDFQSRVPTQPEAARGLGSHSLKNVAAHLSVACGPETQSCGTAVGDKI